MDTFTIVVLAIVILAVAAGFWFYMQKQRTNRLRTKFGPEYGRTVHERGSLADAERVLQEREKRVERFEIKPLSEQQREEFAQAWEQEQARFVDRPRAAVEGADRLVAEVMEARGYPVGEFEQRVADVSVDHPVVVENYRIAHAIAMKDQKQPVDTEELREAMLHYRALFADLLHDGGVTPVRTLRSEPRGLAKEVAR